MLAAASPFLAFQQSDWLGRCVVLLLFLASVLAWTIVADKALYLRDLRRRMRGFLATIDMQAPIAVLLSAVAGAGPLDNVAAAAADALAAARGRDLTPADEQDPPPLSAAQLAHIEQAVEGAVDREVLAMEARLDVLGSVVSASPFLGLLGTVWGVMLAFLGMAAAGKADINALAPGVSGALLTTVVALVVAIPALIAYNQLTTQVRRLTCEVESFAGQLVAALRLAGGDR
jgi:biopolymer transport protein ExbB/TolQ